MHIGENNSTLPPTLEEPGRKLAGRRWEKSHTPTASDLWPNMIHTRSGRSYHEGRGNRTQSNVAGDRSRIPSTWASDGDIESWTIGRSLQNPRTRKPSRPQTWNARIRRGAVSSFRAGGHERLLVICIPSGGIPERRAGVRLHNSLPCFWVPFQ